jgi:hypothetical protein
MISAQVLSSYISTSTLVLLLAQVMGMYFLSSVLLMRMNLPKHYRCDVDRESPSQQVAGQPSSSSLLTQICCHGLQPNHH